MAIPIKRGSDHPNARFSPEEVEEMRKCFDERHPTYKEMAAERGCSPNTVFRLVNGQSYRSPKR
jgi:AraC-like DNA-binding protein